MSTPTVQGMKTEPVVQQQTSQVSQVGWEVLGRRKTECVKGVVDRAG